MDKETELKLENLMLKYMHKEYFTFEDIKEVIAKSYEIGRDNANRSVASKLTSSMNKLEEHNRKLRKWV